MGGLRHDWFKDDNEDRLTGTKSSQDDTKLTWRTGVLYLFDAGVAPYVSYSTSFLPEIGADADGNPFEPTGADQYEVGVKYQPESVNALVTLSTFHITQENALTGDPDNEGFSIQVGEIRSCGIELEAVASLFEGFNVIGSFTYQDVEITESNDGDEGNRPSGTPEYLALRRDRRHRRRPAGGRVDGDRAAAGKRAGRLPAAGRGQRHAGAAHRLHGGGPLMMAGVPVELPKTSAERLGRPQEPLIVSLARDGRVFVQSEPVTEAELVPRLRELAAGNTERVVDVRGDRSIAYGEVMRLMGAVGRAGLSKLSQIGEAEVTAVQARSDDLGGRACLGRPGRGLRPPRRAGLAVAGSGGEQHRGDRHRQRRRYARRRPAGAQQDYLTRLAAWLGRHKGCPRSAQRRGEEGTVLLRFAIDREGRVLGWRTVRGSGHAAPDDEVSAMIRRAEPLPPMPPEMPQPRIELTVPIRFRLG